MQNEGRFSALFLPFLVIFAVGIFYLVLYKNPKLLDKKTFKESLQASPEAGPKPMPTRPKEAADSGADYYDSWDYSNLVSGRNVFANNKRVSHRYFRPDTQEFLTEQPGVTPNGWIMNHQGFFLWIDKGEAYATDFEGQKLWSFRLKSEEPFAGRPAFSKTEVYFAAQKGRFFALEKDSGKIIWHLELGDSVTGDLLATKEALFAVLRDSKDDSSFRLARLNRISGEVDWTSEAFEGSLNTELRYDVKRKLLIAGVGDNKVLAILAESGKTKWTYECDGKVDAAPTLWENFAFVATSSGKAIAINMDKGDMAWEYELTGPSSHPFEFIPDINLIVLQSDQGYLHILEAKTGKSKWRFNTRNAQSANWAMGVRLSDSSIVSLELAWGDKGWTIWSPCAKDRICVFKPKTGELIWRVRNRGSLHSRLYFRSEDDSFYSALEDFEAKADGAEKGPLRMARFIKYVPPKKKSPIGEELPQKRTSDANGNIDN